MSLAIVSPHLDDAAFSLSEHLSVRPGATIICPFGGTPPDHVGQRKYNRLHAEHVIACKMLNAVAVNGPFLDDVYPDQDTHAISMWFKHVLSGFDEVWIPVGIHHPDHIVSSRLSLQAAYGAGKVISFYEELPYRVLYPQQVDYPIINRCILQGSPTALSFKREVCRAYDSQIGPEIERCLYAPELLWKFT